MLTFNVIVVAFCSCYSSSGKQHKTKKQKTKHCKRFCVLSATLLLLCCGRCWCCWCRQPAPNEVIKLQGKQSNRCATVPDRAHPPPPHLVHDWIINSADSTAAALHFPAFPFFSPAKRPPLGSMNNSGRPICYCPISLQQCDGANSYCCCCYCCCCRCLWTCHTVAAVSPWQIAAVSRDCGVACNFHRVITATARRQRLLCMLRISTSIQIPFKLQGIYIINEI